MFLMFFLFIIRDVNSREIAFPGRKSQFPSLNRDSKLGFRLSAYLLPTL